MFPGRRLAGGKGIVGEKVEETEVDLWVLAVGAGVDGGGLSTSADGRRWGCAAAAVLR